MTGAVLVEHVGYTVSRVLLDDITLDFCAGELTAVSGPSGSGKTTLLSIVGGLVKATTGSVEYDASPTWQGTGDPRSDVAFILQVYGLVPILSARENVSIALRARGVRPADADERAEAALARFNIADLGDRQVEELSGGQMQRVACARGFVVGAAVLLADEPTSELDEGNRGLVMEQLRAEAQRGAVVVVATHDPAVVAECDRHYALDEGRLVLAERRPRRSGAERAVSEPSVPDPSVSDSAVSEPGAPSVAPAEPSAPEPSAPEPSAPEPSGAKPEDAPHPDPVAPLPLHLAPEPPSVIEGEPRSPFARPVEPTEDA